MKKVLCVLMAAIMCFALAGCGGSSASLTKSDFSFYDNGGKEIAHLTEDNTYMFLESINKQKGGNYQTKKGIKIGDKATDICNKYDLSGYYWNPQRFHSDTAEEQANDKKLHEKYKDAVTAIQNSNAITSNGDNLFISATYSVESNGDLKKCELDENGNPKNPKDDDKDLLEIDFTISNEKVKDVSLSNNAAMK